MIDIVPQGIGLRDTTGFAAPVGGGVRVESLQTLAKWFRLMTSAGEINARVVVICTRHPSARTSRPGRPAFRPGVSARCDPVPRPERLPPGQVLIVGRAQAGCRLAEELHLTGRDVFLSCGPAPRAPRRGRLGHL
jgi:putative flavoprotein involved in K+ transport